MQQGGPIIQDESDIAVSKYRGYQIKVGNCADTGAGSLPFRTIIHAVGPIWEQGGPEKIAQLKSAVNNSIELGGVMGIRSMAIPAISSGVCGTPKDICAQSLIEEVLAYAEKKAA